MILSDGLEIPDEEFDGYIFDNDGTLALSMGLHHEAWVHAYRKNQASFEFTREYAQSLAGVGMLDTVVRVNQEFSQQLDPEQVVADQENYYRRNVHKVLANEPLVAFAREVAEKRKVAVASGGVWETVIGTLGAIGLREVFEVIVTQDQVKRGKPAPDLFLEAARRMGVDPTRCLVFEDGLLGLEAAKAAGMKAVFVPTGDPTR